MLCATFKCLAIPSLLALAACGGGGPGSKTTLLSPARWASFENSWIEDNSSTGTAGDGMVALYGGGLEAILVGWEHFYEPDESRMLNHVYSGAVRFDVDAFDPASGRKIKKATLSYTVHTGDLRPMVGFFETDPMLLRIPTTSAWTGAPAVDAPPELATTAYPYLPYGVGEVPVGLVGSTIHMDVTALAKDWALGTGNTGLVFRSSDFGTMGPIADSEAHWQILRDFHLTIEWTF